MASQQGSFSVISTYVEVNFRRVDISVTIGHLESFKIEMTPK